MPVILSAEAARQIEALQRPIQARIAVVLARLGHWPAVSGAKPLRGELAGHFRIRTGDFRVQFVLRGTDVVIEKVGHRDGFYAD